MAIITIDQDVCTGCKECTAVCPAFAIEGELHKPQHIVEERCVNCGQCVQKCKSYVSLVDHGAEMYYNKRAERGLPETMCEPLFAAYNTSRVGEALAALADPSKFTMATAAPAVRVGIAEEFGLPYGALAAGKLAAGLRRLGFDRVYDTDFAADLTIMEEGTELVERVTKGGVLPMFTSCCPAWVRWLENNHPTLTKHLSTSKSPQQMGGAILKTWGAKLNDVVPEKVFVLSIMPCTAQQAECSRPEMNASGQRDVDVTITTRELAYLFKLKGIDFANLPEEAYDDPLGDYTGAGAIFGATGGVMEAAIRTGYTLITGQELDNVDITQVRGVEGVRSAEIKAGDLTLKVGIVTNLKNIDGVIEKLQSGALDGFHFIEVRTCPEGCVSGGGQPKLFMDTDRPAAYAARRESLFQHDRDLPLRKSHQNPGIKRLYAEYLGKPCAEKSHHLLHTTYKE
jgi:ferredoxin hydrogenase